MRITTYKTYVKDNTNVLVKDKSTNYSSLTNISAPSMIVEIMINVFNIDKLAEEHVYLICLNSKNIPQGFFLISQGTVNKALVSNRNIYNRAMLIGAVNIILVHNHPSGNCEPSSEDRLITKKIIEAGHLLEIPLVDHIIIGNNCFYSFREQGEISS